MQNQVAQAVGHLIVCTYPDNTDKLLLTLTTIT